MAGIPFVDPTGTVAILTLGRDHEDIVAHHSGRPATLGGVAWLEWDARRSLSAEPRRRRHRGHHPLATCRTRGRPAFSHVAVVPSGATTIYVGGQNGVDASGAVVSMDIAEQSSRAIDNVAIALDAAGAALTDVVQWTVLIDADADLGAAYGAIAPRLAGLGAPPLVTAARVAGLGVPGALIEVSAIAAVLPAYDRLQ